MLNYIRNFFNKKKSEAKSKSIKQQLLELSLGSYVVFDLHPDICSQHVVKKLERFDPAVLSNKKLKGLIKAVYTSDLGHVYVEVLGLVVGDGHSTRKEYVVMDIEMTKVTVLS
jgi:hypothetical protein